jgi:hypothetical protein
VRHLLARSLGHLAYACRYLAEARGHFAQAARLAPDDHLALADLLAQAHVAAAEGRGELAFDLLLASADLARTAGDDAARSTALMEAVTVAHRIAGTFTHEVPHSRLRELLAEAERLAPADDPVAAARLAAAAAWNAQAEKAAPDPQLAAAALAAARSSAGSSRWLCRASLMRRSPMPPACGRHGDGQEHHRPTGRHLPPTPESSSAACAATATGR